MSPAGYDAAGPGGSAPWGEAGTPGAGPGGGPGPGAPAPGGPGSMAADYGSVHTPAADPAGAATSSVPSAGEPGAGPASAGPDDAATSGIPRADNATTAMPPASSPSEPGPEAELPTNPNGRGPITRPYTRQAGYEDYGDVLQPVEYARPQAPNPAAPPPQQPVASVPPGGYGPPPQAPPGYGHPDPYADQRHQPDQAGRPKSPGWHPFLSLLCGVIAIGATVVLPTVATCVILVALVLLRAIDHASSRLAVRRSARGPKGSDPLLVALGTPWGVVRGGLIQLLMIPLAAIVGGIVFGVLVWAKPGLPTDSLAGYAAGACTLMLVVGPGSGAPRRGLNRTIGMLARGGASTAVVALVLSLVTLLAVVGAATAQPKWQPVHVTHRSPNSLVDEGKSAAGSQATRFVRKVVEDVLGKTFG